MKIRSLLKTLLFAFTAYQEFRQSQAAQAPASDAAGDKEDLRVEYREIGKNLRHYANQRLGLLAMAIALNVALGAVLLSGGYFSSCARSLLPLFGAAAAVVILVLESAAARKGRGLKDRAKNIEEVLDLRTEGAAVEQNRGQYTDLARAWLCPSKVLAAFYAGIFLAWLALFVASFFCSRAAYCPWVGSSVGTIAVGTAAMPTPQQ